MHPTLKAFQGGFCAILLIGLAACPGGGGDGGGGGGNPTQPVDNSVGRVDVSPSALASLISGTTATLTATAFTKDNRSLGAAGVSWLSSNEGVATVAAGVITARLVGTATITASAGGISSPGVTVTVSAGAASQLGIRTQPGAAMSGLALTPGPVVEVRDAAGNVVASSSAVVTATIGSGAGTLSGNSAVPASQGVANFNSMTVTGLVGARTLVFSATGLTSVTSASFALAAGAATQLAVRTQPVASTAYAVFTAPAVVEVRDASGNVAESGAAIVATIASGGGTLGGTTTVNAAAGVATFATLTVNGVAGARTLTFSSGTLTAVTTTSFNLAAAPPAVIALSPSPAVINATQGSNPAAVNVIITNTGVFPLTNLRVTSTTYQPVSPAGWLAATFPLGTDAPSTFRLTATSATVPLGTYTAVVVIAGDGAAATVSLTVTLIVAPQTVNTYGTAANKVSVMNIGTSLLPGLVTTTGSGTVATTDPTVTYASRSPAIATVDATGRITAVAQGQVWVAATSTTSNSDSVLIIVPRATGPVLRTDITRYRWAVGDTITVRIQVDTRGASLGAITATVAWPVWIGSGVFGTMTLVDVTTAGSAMALVTSVDNQVNVIRITGGSAAGATGLLQLATIRFRIAAVGLKGIFLDATEMVGADFANLLPTVTVTQYPVIVP